MVNPPPFRSPQVPPALRWILPLCCACLLMADGITPAGVALAGCYDGMAVETHWLPGRRVDWRTGEPIAGRPGKTHCSAFAAAACDRLGLYLLRPPEHRQQNLANAQARWLEREGRRLGWRPVSSPQEAQDLANEGQAVLVLWANPDPHKSGHIALVRPFQQPDATLQAEGPQIIQAGGTNAASISVRQGFRRHRGAWTDALRHHLRFYAHTAPILLGSF